MIGGDAQKFVLCALLLAGLAFPAQAELAPTGTLRVVFLGTNPVQGRVDQATGAITGPVADLTRALAARIGKPYRIIPVTEPAAVIGSIQSGDADVALLAIEAARATQVEFSIPYLLMGNAYLVKADSRIQRSADVDRTGVVIGAVQGVSQQIWLSEHLKSARLRMWPAVPPGAEIVRLVTSGEVHAFAANRQRMEDVANSSSGVRVLPDDFSSLEQALAVRKGNRSGLDELNAFLRDALATGLVSASIDAAHIAGARPAPPPAR